MVLTRMNSDPRPADDDLDLVDSIPDPAAHDIVYKIAETTREREMAFQLVHRSYTQAGLIDENPHGMRVTPFHLLDTTELFVAVYQEQVICTLTLIGDGDLGVPMESIFGPEIDLLRRKGAHFGEVSCLADRRRQLSRILPVFIKLTRLMAQYARRQGMQYLLIAVHPRHVRFYRRFMAFESFADERSYPNVRNKPAIACLLDFERARRETPAIYAQFFDDPLDDEKLAAQPMSSAERELFGPSAACGQIIVPMAFD